MAAMASCVGHAFVRNACVLRFMLVRSAAAGFQRNYFQTRTCYQFSALHRSPFMQVLYCRIDVVISKAVIQYCPFNTAHFLHVNLWSSWCLGPDTAWYVISFCVAFFNLCIRTHRCWQWCDRSSYLNILGV